MKKIYLSLIAVLAVCQITYAQWTTNSANTVTSTPNSVGIGTVSPQGGLDINNVGGYWCSYNFGTNLLIRGTTHHNSIGIFDSTNANPWAVTNVAGALWFSQMPVLGDVTTNPTSRVTFAANGNVGIGTQYPISAFQVNDGCIKTSIGSALGANLNYGTSYIGFNAARDANNNWSVSSDGVHNGGGVMYNDIFGNIYFSPIISSASNSASPQSLTDLNIKSNIAVKISNTGVLFAKQINVTLTGWPDYVFKKEYHLPSLSEVKTYIDKNHHLSEIPSAEQIEKDGLNLGEMNKLLLQKVEELTLYTISSDKRVREEAAVIEQQKKLLTQQTATVTELRDEVELLKQQVQLLIKTTKKN
jgi:hypothetical protein